VHEESGCRIWGAVRLFVRSNWGFHDADSSCFRLMGPRAAYRRFGSTCCLHVQGIRRRLEFPSRRYSSPAWSEVVWEERIGYIIIIVIIIIGPRAWS
jgi:hypothetical protein